MVEGTGITLRHPRDNALTILLRELDQFDQLEDAGKQALMLVLRLLLRGLLADEKLKVVADLGLNPQLVDTLNPEVLEGFSVEMREKVKSCLRALVDYIRTIDALDPVVKKESQNTQTF